MPTSKNRSGCAFANDIDTLKGWHRVHGIANHEIQYYHLEKHDKDGPSRVLGDRFSRLDGVSPYRCDGTVLKENQIAAFF